MRVSKKELVKLKEAYRRQCQLKSLAIFVAYFADWAFKIYLGYKVGGVGLALLMTTCDFAAKAYHLKNTKFRKPKDFKITQSKRS